MDRQNLRGDMQNLNAFETGMYLPGMENPEEIPQKKDFFQKMMFPTLLYAALFTFFLYNNLSGITMPMCVLATIIYCAYAFKQFHITVKKDTYFYAGAMLLMGISSATTGNGYMIAMNTLALALILVSMLMHNFCNDREWGFVKSLTALCEIFVYSIEALPTPITDGVSYQRSNKKKAQSKSLYILIGVAISIPLVIFIIVMLYQADAVFAEVIRKIFVDIDIATIMAVSFVYIFAFFCAYCGMRALEKNKISGESKDYRHYEPLVAITVLSIISVVYVFFSMIQIMYLFLGKMTLPEGFTYAQYARQGFFQLLTVCILNVMIVLSILGFFRKSKVLGGLLAVISGCTYIMLASSAFRMLLYVQNYGLTLLRILVLWAIGLIGILLMGIILQIFMEKFPLFRYGIVVTSLWFIAMSFSHPDYMIAKYNLSSHVNKNEVDYEYLTRLSSDAAPVLAELDGIWGEKYAFHLSGYKNDSIRKYNFSRARARKIFGEQIEKKKHTVCVILEKPEGIELDCVKLKHRTGNQEFVKLAAEKIPGTGKKQGGYIVYLPMERDKNIEIAYDFSIKGKAYTTDTCNIYANEGYTYRIGMDTCNYENGIDEPFVIYQN